jgi:50S ribosomal subunit-associated GTPase HflX
MLDTVGFITDLPHGLVESFKATLEEIHFADVIVHVRDISHPHTDHQRSTVLRVLEEIGISDEYLKQRYIEVWNKIDLVEDRASLKIEDEGYPVVMMSCKTGENRDEFLNFVSDMACDRMGKK